ncbi:MAG: DUF1569 domain-containing protein [Rhodoferax sp.]
MSLRRNRMMKPRRHFLAKTGAAVLVAAGTGSASASESDRALLFQTLAQAMGEVKALAQSRSITSHTQWSFPQTLVHAAQSIEYSMTGFPQPRSALFQHTVGAAAFAMFDLRGRMFHSLVEPIPGAPAVEASTDLYQAVERLEVAVVRFGAWNAPLQPHFAYGLLTKSAYERAHAMHLANHLSAFSGDPL